MIDKEYTTKLRQKQQQLKTIIHDAEKTISKSPQGAVRIIKHGKRVQYYFRKTPQDKNGVYMPVSDQKRAASLVKKRYLNKLLAAAKKQYRAIESFLRDYSEEALQKVLENEGELRHTIILPYILSGGKATSIAEDISPIAILQDELYSGLLPDTDYAQIWQSVEYQGKGFRDDMPLHITQKQERVRSKSEVLIANALLYANIPYRYECPLQMGNHIVYPDFTILRPVDRKQVYWEHLGMMDDKEYQENAFEKIRIYEEFGLFPGDDIIFTVETSRLPLNSITVDQMIRHYILGTQAS